MNYPNPNSPLQTQSLIKLGSTDTDSQNTDPYSSNQQYLSKISRNELNNKHKQHNTDYERKTINGRLTLEPSFMQQE